MKKQFTVLLAVVLFALVFTPSAWCGKKTIKIGFNIPLTGDIPKVGEGSKYTAEMIKKQILGVNR